MDKGQREYTTQQERLWAGEHTEAYIERTKSEWMVQSKTALFARILAHLRGIESVLELGANIGLNIHALRRLRSDFQITALEINPTAAEYLRNITDIEVHEGSLLEFDPGRSWDFVFTKGVLIHVNPDRLKDAYDLLYNASSRYICIIEYYDPHPTMIPHRGLEDQMFKRDFPGELMDAHPDLNLLDYGFVYHRDPVFPLDDITWFLFEKPRRGAAVGDG